MMTFIKSKAEWPRWNELIFRDKKDGIVVSMSKIHPMYKELMDELKYFRKTYVVAISPRDFKEITNSSNPAEIPTDVPMIAGYQDGEAVVYISGSRMMELKTVKAIIDVLSVHFV